MSVALVASFSPTGDKEYNFALSPQRRGTRVGGREDRRLGVSLRRPD